MKIKLSLVILLLPILISAQLSNKGEFMFSITSSVNIKSPNNYIANKMKEVRLSQDVTSGWFGTAHYPLVYSPGNGYNLRLEWYKSNKILLGVMYGFSKLGGATGHRDDKYIEVQLQQQYAMPTVKYEFDKIFEIDAGMGISNNISFQPEGFSNSKEYKEKYTRIVPCLYGGVHFRFVSKYKFFNIKMGLSGLITTPTEIGDFHSNRDYSGGELIFNSFPMSYYSLKVDITASFHFFR